MNGAHELRNQRCPERGVLNVLFINCVCSNSGDVAIFQAATAVIRAAFGSDIELLVYDDHPQRVRKLYPNLDVRGSCYWNLEYTDLQGWRGWLVRRLRFMRFRIACWLKRHGAYFLAKPFVSKIECDYLSAYARADIVIATGGTYLVEHYDLSQRVFDMTAAIAMRRPLVLFTQSAGPFQSPTNRRRLGHIFRKARLILLRDARSRNHLRELNVSEARILLSPDAAFALADDDLLTRPIDSLPLAKPRPRIAISVRQWNYFSSCSNQEGMERYSAAFASLTEHLVKQYDAAVTFLSTCQGVAGYHDDSRLASAIVATLPEDMRCHVTVDSTFHTPGELMEHLREFDWVVATRMHLAIMALGVGAPVLPIAYEFKTIELFRGLGYEHDILTVDTLTSESLIEGFEFSVESYGRIAHKIREAVDRYRRDAWQVTEILRKEFPELVPCGASQVERAATISEDHVRVRSPGP